MKGFKQPLQESDLFELNDVDKAGAWVPNFERNWQHETNRIIRYPINRKKIFIGIQICLFPISLMANLLNLNSVYYYIFRNLSMIVYIIEIQKSNFML